MNRFTRAVGFVVGVAGAGVVLTASLAAAPDKDKAPPTQAELLKKSCDKNTAEDCFKLAGMHRQGQGEGVVKDASKAAGLFKKACEHRHGRSCLELAGMVRAGEGAKRDLPRANGLLTL